MQSHQEFRSQNLTICKLTSPFATLTMASSPAMLNIPHSTPISSMSQSLKQSPKPLSFATMGLGSLTIGSSLRSQLVSQFKTPKRLSFVTKTYSSQVKTSSQAVTAKQRKQVIERLVLFIILPGVEQHKVDALLEGLKDLASEETVTFLTAGPLHRYDPDPFEFPIFLQVRFNSLQDREEYLSSEAYKVTTRKLMEGVCEEVLMQEWCAEVEEQAFPSKGGAIRTTFYKLKEELGEEHEEQVLKVIAELENFHGSVLQHSYGKNFTPLEVDHKLYSIASLSVFPNIKDLDAFAENEEFKLHVGKVKDYLDDVRDFDYIL